MIKTDLILQIVGVTAIAALGIPVAISVKYRDGTVKAAELQDAFGILAWKVDVAAPMKFSQASATLESISDGKTQTIASVEVPFEKGSKATDITVFLSGTDAHLGCNDVKVTGILSGSQLSKNATTYRLGGKGKETDPGTFILVEDSSRSIRLVVTIN